jgi:hypothetical protein
MMQILETISAISFLIVVLGLAGIYLTLIRSSVARGYTVAVETVQNAKPVPFHPRKGHRRPCADVGKAILTYRYLDEGRTMFEIATYFGMPVSSLQKLLDKHGKAARREMEARA